MREATPAVHAPPDRPRPAGRRDHPADGPPDLFATVLASTAGPPPQAKAADTEARTAHAEGDRAGCDSAGQTESQTAVPSQAAAPAVADATPAAPAAQAAVTALPAATPQDAAQVAPDTAQPTPTAPSSPVKATPAAAPVATPADDALPTSAPVAQPAAQPAAQATTASLEQTAAPQTTPAQPEAAADAAQPTPQQPGQAATPVAHAAAAGKQTATTGEGHEHHQGQERQQPQTGTAPEVTAASARRTRRGAHRPQPIASTRTQQPMSSTPAQAEGAAPASETGAPTHAAAATAPAGRVRILELAESMRAVVSVANRRGSATARIMLRPDTLGGVQVKLRAGRDGVSAELIADSAHAAQALATAGGDLRRALEAQGVNLLGLDVRTAGDGAEAHGHEGRRAAESELRGAEGGMDAGEDPEITIESSRLPDPGSQVDVLA